MKKILQSFILLVCVFGYSQSVIQTVNSGSLITANSSVSIGEIIITPETTTQSSSGIIGILAQVNNQTLEVPELELTEQISVYPNPTSASISFKTNLEIENETVSIYNSFGKLVFNRIIGTDKTIDLSSIASGIYIIQFSNKKLQSFKIIKR